MNENMTDQDKIEFKEKYQNDPVAFCEEIMNIKLLPYQKEMLRLMNIKNKRININPWRNGKQYCFNLHLEYMKAMEANFQVWNKDSIDVYEKGILVKTIKHDKKGI